MPCLFLFWGWGAPAPHKRRRKTACNLSNMADTSLITKGGHAGTAVTISPFCHYSILDKHFQFSTFNFQLNKNLLYINLLNP